MTVRDECVKWEYRIVEVNNVYAVYEVYYFGRDGVSRSDSPVSPEGDTLDDLTIDFEYYKLAMELPVLREIDLRTDK